MKRKAGEDEEVQTKPALAERSATFFCSLDDNLVGQLTIPAQLLPKPTRAHAVDRNMVRIMLIDPNHIPHICHLINTTAM